MSTFLFKCPTAIFLIISSREPRYEFLNFLVVASIPCSSIKEKVYALELVDLDSF